MKRIYIEPCIELVNIETESLLAGLSGTGTNTWNNVDITEKVGLEIDNDGDDDNIYCTKPTDPNLWDDEEW